MKSFRTFDKRHEIRTKHQSFVHDIAYDFYGRSLASCSSDQSIKLWTQNSEGDWELSAEIANAHSGSVQRLSWAHPQFGKILASCSIDGEVKVYEVKVDAKSGQKSFKEVTRQADSRVAVRDLQFAPHHLGIKLATCSIDGRIRIYEATDLMNLSLWSLPEHFEVSDHANCLCWNPSPTDAATMVVGSNNSAEVWEFHAQNRRWQHLLSLKEGGKSDPHDGDVQDVAWAPQLGRSYHLIATACRDTFVRVFKVYLHNVPKGQEQVALVAEIGAHQTEVWRVSWNVTGTMLASTGDDGMTRLWKSDFSLNFHPVLLASGSEDTSSSSATKPLQQTQQQQQQPQQSQFGFSGGASESKQSTGWRS